MAIQTQAAKTALKVIREVGFAKRPSFQRMSLILITIEIIHHGSTLWAALSKIVMRGAGLS